MCNETGVTSPKSSPGVGHSGTVHPDVMSAVWRAAEHELGDGVESIFASLDLSSRVPVNDALQVWSALAALDDDGTLGARLGAHQLSHCGVLGALVSAAGAQPTMGRAMRIVSRYFALVSSTAEISIEVCGAPGAREFHVNSLTGAGYRNPVVVQSTLRVLLAGIRDITGQRTPLQHVTLMSPIRPGVCERLARLFGAPVFAGATADSLVFPATFAEQSLPASLRAARSEKAAAAEAFAFDVDATPLQERVAKEIQLLLPRAPTLDAVANRLALSKRTLQRRLGAEGMQLRELCRITRLHIARGYLSVGGGVEEVAHLIGYTEATAFTHAYREAFGRAPVQDRNAQTIPRR